VEAVDDGGEEGHELLVGVWLLARTVERADMQDHLLVLSDLLPHQHCGIEETLGKRSAQGGVLPSEQERALLLEVIRQ
jgi:hypothetical protein